MEADHRWKVLRSIGEIDSLLGLGPAGPARRTVVICRPKGSGVVLGSSQPESDIDPGALSSGRHLEDSKPWVVARRSSGGTAVLVREHKIVWIEVIVPKEDPLWDQDIIKASLWLGRTWQNALSKLGASDLSVHGEKALGNPSSKVCCFAGLGPGEVLSSGRKVVGISQRRTRYGALFQCAVPLELGAVELAGVLSGSTQRRQEIASALMKQSVGLHDMALGVSVLAVESAFLSSLP